jgi:hypothetical protein
VEISQACVNLIFKYHGKQFNEEILKTIEAYAFCEPQYAGHPFVLGLPTKNDCAKKIEFLQAIIKTLKTFHKKNHFTDEDVRRINDDINIFFMGEIPYHLRDFFSVPEKKEKERKKRAGFIYFLQEHTGKVKIGKTKFLGSRIFDLGIKFPIKPILIHSFPTEDITESERELHKKYHKFRLEGEWFKLSKREIEKIKEQYPQNQNKDNE